MTPSLNDALEKINTLIELLREYKKTMNKSILDEIHNLISWLVRKDQYLTILLQNAPDRLVLLLDLLREHLDTRWGYFLLTIKTFQLALKKPKLSHKLLLEVISLGEYPVGDVVELLGVTWLAYKKALIEILKKRKQEKPSKILLKQVDKRILYRLEYFKKFEEDLEQRLKNISEIDLFAFLKSKGFAEVFSRERAAAILKLLVDKKIKIKEKRGKLYVTREE